MLPVNIKKILRYGKGRTFERKGVPESRVLPLLDRWRQLRLAICERNGSGYRRAGRVTEYEGETGANGFSRGKEQAGGLRMEEEDNALWKHCQLEHGGEKVEFSMKVLGSFQSSMARQVNEGVRIKRSKADCLMNSKSEFHQHPVVRVVPMRGIQQEQGEDGQRGRVARSQGR